MEGKQVVGSLSCNLDKNEVLRKRKSRSESDTDDLSDIDDAEISKYLNNNTETVFKKMVWEAMNKDYGKPKQKKPAVEKKSTSAKKVFAGRLEKGEEGEKENRKRLSSKINYDALEKLSHEPEEAAAKAKKGGIDSNRSNQIETQQGTSSAEVVSTSEEENDQNCRDDELEPENANLYSYGDDENEEYGYWDDYDHEEF